MEQCTICEGSGKQTVTISTFGEPENDTSFESNCIGCDGEGEVTEEQAALIEFEKNMWCKCGNPSEDVDFYDDGEHPEITKHHYRCKDCKKVVQIG